MKPSRPIAWLLAILVIAAQLATSAYACTMPASAPKAAVAIQAMDDCAGTDDPAAPLCERHCRDEAQGQGPAVVALPAYAPSFFAVVAQPPLPQSGTVDPPRVLQHATSPPLAIRHCCLRV